MNISCLACVFIFLTKENRGNMNVDGPNKTGYKKDGFPQDATFLFF